MNHCHSAVAPRLHFQFSHSIYNFFAHVTTNEVDRNVLAP
ncbi:hypothetical protein SXCC_02026 [Gluconacetobacter sp. SXCC-1]|nr:hypothetical protein SXCC_02026 [Gluconacetobacter sp. SXCC-1]